MAIVKSSKKGDVRERLLAALDKVSRPGDFCCSGDIGLVMPGLEVDGLGSIALPLLKSQTRKLIKRCSQAPYGKGTETVVDTGVRNVWELDPEHFSITNPRWSELIEVVLGHVKNQLGLDQHQLKAELYKLLVYEQGSFFLPHRDGEKIKGMLATLVIALPAVHEGGELIVVHDGASQTISMTGAASGLELSYAAFYADCEHEVRPVTSGYRLCLTYNVSLAKSKAGLLAPSYGEETAAIAEVLSHWREQGEGQKLAITLDHLYTQDGLTIDRLKGIDRTRAEILFAAAERAGFVGHLALLTLWQTGSAEGGYDAYSYGRGRGYRRSYDGFDDDQDDYDETACDYDLTEAHLAAIFKLRPRLAKLSKPNKPVTRWLQACKQELASRTLRPPQPPADFRRERKLSCSCGDCLRVNKFLDDPSQKVLRLPLAKERRKHLHRSIDGDRCDLTHTTLRSGRPFTLICTKTDASYRESCKIYDRDRKNLARLQELIESMI